MEKAYWLGRRRASIRSAQSAASSRARLIHYDLAGRYGLKALSAETGALDPADPPPSTCADHGDEIVEDTDDA